jgi:hypothetical protein
MSQTINHHMHNTSLREEFHSINKPWPMSPIHGQTHLKRPSYSTNSKQQSRIHRPYHSSLQHAPSIYTSLPRGEPRALSAWLVTLGFGEVRREEVDMVFFNEGEARGEEYCWVSPAGCWSARGRRRALHSLATPYVLVHHGTMQAWRWGRPHHHYLWKKLVLLITSSSTLVNMHVYGRTSQ